jgi:predicted aspartyl protease
MPSVRGFLDDSGTSWINFHLCGVAHDPPGLEVKAIVDTGFSGFLAVPMPLAFQLKLPLEGTINLESAGGQVVPHLQSLARMTLAGRTETVPVVLMPHSKVILVGTQIFRLFQMGLLILADNVLLVDETEHGLD